MRQLRIVLISLLLPVLFFRLTVHTHAAPLAATAMQEGRTYDQAHDLGFIDWNGSAQYVYITHRDGSSLPPEEGGVYCGSGCSEWVTRLGNGATAGGSFDRNVSYFEVMVSFTGEGGVGTAVLQACSNSMSWALYNNTSLPGFVSMILAVPAGCRSWSLSASGGFVDFRSIDVTYVGPPNTATPTASRTPTFTPTSTGTSTATSTPTLTYTPTATYTPTRTPTLTYTPTATFTPTWTPTMTYTPTPTFTPTATFTNTPSSTPTPLPPQIMGVVDCDLWGDAGWCRGNETLELTARDPQGFGVTIHGDLNGVLFTCGSSCDLPLPEGAGTARYVVTSTSGKTASGISTWRRDATPPDLDPSLPPVNGRNGWYVSQVEVSASAVDAVSGLASLNGSLNGGTTWSSFPIHCLNGDHQMLIHARDVAGNEVTESRVIRVDGVPPTARINPLLNEAIQGEVLLTGTLLDEMSGPAGGEISIDEGTTWHAVSLDRGNAWSYLWRSNEVSNGEYTLLMRGMDRAGNVGGVDSITLSVDNGPPAVSITERWWIWQEGQMKVSANHFSIATIRLKIRDPHRRWKDMTLDFDPGRDLYIVKWDRRFTDVMAPAGEYLVLAEACDVNGLCGRDEGWIMIPEVSSPTATFVNTPTVTSTLMPSATPTPSPVPPTPTLALHTPVPEERPVPAPPFLPLWQMMGLLGLFMVIASASVVDPRPQALKRLGETFEALSELPEGDSIEHLEIQEKK